MSRSKIACYLIVFISSVSFILLPLFAEDIVSEAARDPKAAHERVNDDISLLLVYQDKLADAMKYLNSRNDLFPSKRCTEPRILKQKKRNEVLKNWQVMLDCFMTVDSIGRSYTNCDALEGDLKKDAFTALSLSFLIQYRYALEFISLADNDPGLNTVLDDPLPEMGLPARTYADLKFRFLNVKAALDFSSFMTVYNLMGKSDNEAVAEAINADASYIMQKGMGEGEAMTVANAFAVIGKASSDLFFPVQTGISNFMGDTKVARFDTFLVSQEQLRALPGILEPGDIVLERHEWYLSDAGIPGYWTHVALYTGTPEERDKYFDEGKTVTWVVGQGELSGSFNELLKTRYPSVYALSTVLDSGKYPYRIVEAIRKGVGFCSLENGVRCDDLAVLRPRLSKRYKAEAILKAFRFVGRPYDFNFDFLTDSALVCSELVFKAYEHEKYDLFPRIHDIMGHKLITPNDIAEHFDRGYGTRKQQMDFVIFYDGSESRKRAVEASGDEFRQSWKRPKWYTVTK